MSHSTFPPSHNSEHDTSVSGANGHDEGASVGLLDSTEVRPYSAELEDEAPAGPACPNCDAPGQDTAATWCRKCGFYGKLGTCLELTEWDQEPDEGAEEETTYAADPTYVDVLKMVPQWAWVLLAEVVGILGLAGLVRLQFPAPGGVRMVVSIITLIGGGVTLFMAHLISYVRAASEDSRVALMDFVLRPITIWGHTMTELPAACKRVQAGVCGLTGMLASLVIIGGLPWAALWDWGIEEQAKPNLIAAVTSMAGESDMTMEEALDEFAGKGTRAVQAGDPGAEGNANGGAAPEAINARTEALDCLIVGYYPKPGDEPDFAGLLLASSVDGELAVVGSVSTGIPDDVRAELNEQFAELERATPFVRTSARAIWLNPRLTCRVRFAGWTKYKKLDDPQFEKMLAEINL